MRLVLTLLAAVLLFVPVHGSAQAFVQSEPAVPVAAFADPIPVTEMASTAPAQEEKVQESARAEQRSERDARDDRQLARRGSFWWLVGVIVVAGVILAIVLD